MNMEFLLPSQITLIIPSTFIFFLFIYYLLRKNATTTNQNTLPEARGAWPIVGHLPLFVGRKLAYKVLGALADKHGPIFTIRLGVIRALVVSNSEIAKECFTGSNDKVFLNRPKSIATEHFSYNYATFAASPYGPHWREMRKIAMLELLSNQRLAMLSNVRESEMKILVKEVYEKWVKEGSCLMEMKRWFDDMTLKLTVRLIAGLY